MLNRDEIIGRVKAVYMQHPVPAGDMFGVPIPSSVTNIDAREAVGFYIGHLEDNDGIPSVEAVQETLVGAGFDRDSSIEAAPFAEKVIARLIEDLAMRAGEPAEYFFDELGMGKRLAAENKTPYCSKCGTRKIQNNITGKWQCPKCAKERKS